MRDLLPYALLLALLGCPAATLDDDDDSSADDDDDSSGDDDDDSSGDDDDDSSGDDDDDDDSVGDDDDDTGPAGSAGCGLPAGHAAGGVQLSFELGGDAGGTRGAWLSLPADYDPDVPHRVVVGYAGTNWVGQQIQPYLDLEEPGQAEIFLYPDLQWHDFDGWGNLGGWLLGPHAAPADGAQDLRFTEAALDWLAENYCIDEERVFATGHSWGGDMAQVVSCFLGDRFRASVPVAANRPYWFEPAGGGSVSCVGETEVWTLFGVADEHFSWQDWPGQYGEQQRDFWLEERACSATPTSLAWDPAGGCEAWDGCGVRYCLYGPETGHQIPDWYSEATMEWFRSF